MSADDETLTCQQVVDFLLDYLEAELSASARDVFEEHLEMCPPCQDYLDTYRAAIEMGREVCEREDALEPAPDELVRAILAARDRVQD